MGDSLRDALASLEEAVAEALEAVTAIGTPADIEKFVRLLSQKKIITEMLIEKVDMLEADGNFIRSNPSQAPNLWDQLMNPVKNGNTKDFFL
jgi:hypothetical protein